MGYLFVLGPCICCKNPFSFNPNHVPSLRVHGQREPVCLNCVNRVNPRRVKAGLPEIVPHPDAYEPCNEFEVRS